MRRSLLPGWLVLTLLGCGPATAPKKESPKKPAPVVEQPSAGVLTPAPDAPAPRSRVLDKDPAGCTWVESEATITVSERESPMQARAVAQQNARDSAMREFLGTTIESQTTVFDQEALGRQTTLVENMLRTTRNGRIVKEEIVQKGYRSLPDCESCRYYLRLRACLVQAESHDRDFRVDLGINREFLYEGDEAVLTLISTMDAYVYLYNVGMDWETALLAPNEYVPQIRLEAGRKWSYPDEEAKKRGIRLVAQLPGSRPPVSAETVRVIASKTRLPAEMTDPGNGGYLKVLRRVIASEAVWTDASIQFTINEKK